MLRERLEGFAARALTALWTMAVRNPRTTALGAVGALALAGAHLGFSLTPEQQTKLAGGIVLFIGLVAGDSHRKRGRG